MNINVTVTDVDLTSEIGGFVYEGAGDDEESRPRTIADAVAWQIVSQLVNNRGYYDGLRKHVDRVRDEIIREEALPVIREALNGEIPQTNAYGEKVGGTTTLREVIVAQVKAIVTQRSGDSYSRDGQLTILQKLVRDAVLAQFGKEVTNEVRKAREQMSDQIGATVAEAVKAGMRK